MKKLLWLLLLFPVLAHAAPCPVTVGALTLNVTQPRTSGISPFLAFFDATTSTTTAVLGGAGTVVQDVYFAWNFGDSGVSGGSATWSNGASGQTLKNAATGIVASHLYVLPVAGTTDTTYTVQLWAKVVDASTHVATIASCTVTATALAPSGVNGFPNTSTICAAATTPVAGSGGCPAGAAVQQATTIAGGLTGFGNGKRVLFHCGETFTGNNYTMATNITNVSIGAYGGCENTITNRPIFSNTSTNETLRLCFGTSSVTGVLISDIDFEGNGTANTAVDSPACNAQKQVVYYNLLCHQQENCYDIVEATQSGLVNSTMSGFFGCTSGCQGAYWNYFGNRCVSGSSAIGCGGSTTNSLNCNPDPTSGNIYCDVRYNAMMGNFLSGADTPNNISGITSAVVNSQQVTIVTINTSSATNPFFVNNYILFSGVGGMTQINNVTGQVTAVGGSSGAWTATTNVDSHTFSAYTSGGTATMVTAPTVGVGSETVRIGACRFCVVTNNQFSNSNTVGATLAFRSGNPTKPNWLGQWAEYNEISDNLFMPRCGTVLAEYDTTDPSSDERLRFGIWERNLFVEGTVPINGAKLQIDATNTTARNNVFYVANGLNAPGFGVQFGLRGIEPAPTGDEAYNNTCVNQQSSCVGFSGANLNAPANNSFAANNLFFAPSGSAVTNSGTGNTVNNNTVTVTANPNFVNGSGNFSLLGDFLPQANATGATSIIPNYFDAFQLSWTSVYQLGALSQGAP